MNNRIVVLLLVWQVLGMLAVPFTVEFYRWWLTRNSKLETRNSATADEVEKYRPHFNVGPLAHKEVPAPAAPSIDCPNCGALAGQWCSTFAPFAQLAQCAARVSASECQVSSLKSQEASAS